MKSIFRLSILILGFWFFAPYKGQSQEITNLDSLSGVISEYLLSNKISAVTIANFVDHQGNETPNGNFIIEKIKDKLNSMGINIDVPVVFELFWEVSRLSENSTTMISGFHLSKATGVDAVIVGEINDSEIGIVLKVEILNAKSCQKLALWLVKENKIQSDTYSLMPLRNIIR